LATQKGLEPSTSSLTGLAF